MTQETKFVCFPYRRTFVSNHPVLSEFMDVFPKEIPTEEIPRLPPPREIDFSIEIIPESALVSKVPY